MAHLRTFAFFSFVSNTPCSFSMDVSRWTRLRCRGWPPTKSARIKRTSWQVKTCCNYEFSVHKPRATEFRCCNRFSFRPPHSHDRREIDGPSWYTFGFPIERVLRRGCGNTENPGSVDSRWQHKASVITCTSLNYFSFVCQTVWLSTVKKRFKFAFVCARAGNPVHKINASHKCIQSFT